MALNVIALQKEDIAAGETEFGHVEIRIGVDFCVDR